MAAMIASWARWRSDFSQCSPTGVWPMPMIATSRMNQFLANGYTVQSDKVDQRDRDLTLSTLHLVTLYFICNLCLNRAYVA